MMGSKEILKTTFLTRKEFDKILLVPDDSPSAKKNQGNIPAMSHNINGKLSTGWDLKPTWNTNQNMSTVAVGWIKAHAIPNMLPKYFCLKSFFVSDHNSTLFWKIVLRNPNNYFTPYLVKYHSIVFLMPVSKFSSAFQPSSFSSLVASIA